MNEAPYVQLGLNDLQGLNSMLYCYLQFLLSREQEALLLAERNQKIYMVTELQHRLQLSQPVQAMGKVLAFPLTVEEVSVIQEAMRFFIKKVQCLIPPTRKRDEVLQAVQAMQQTMQKCLVEKHSPTNEAQ